MITKKVRKTPIAEATTFVIFGAETSRQTEYESVRIASVYRPRLRSLHASRFSSAASVRLIASHYYWLLAGLAEWRPINRLANGQQRV